MWTHNQAETDTRASTLHLSATLIRAGRRLGQIPTGSPADGRATATEVVRFVAGLLVLTGVVVEWAIVLATPHRS